MKTKSGYTQIEYGKRLAPKRGAAGNRTATGLRVDEVGVIMAKGRQVDPDYTFQSPDDFTGMVQEKYPLGGRAERCPNCNQ